MSEEEENRACLGRMSQPGAVNNVSSGLPYFSDQPNRNASRLELAG